MTENVLPQESTSQGASAMLRVQATSKLAFGATTVALVTLASGGTAVLVNHGTSGLSSPTALPAGARPSLPDGGSEVSPVVVDRAPGTWGQAPRGRTVVDRTVKALRDALAQRPVPGRRTVIAPLVDLVAHPDGHVVPLLPPVAAPQPVLAPTGEVPQPPVPTLTPRVAASPDRCEGDGGNVHKRTPGSHTHKAAVQKKKAAKAVKAGNGHHRAKGKHAR